MQLKDVCAPFLARSTSMPTGAKPAEKCLRVSFLTNNPALRTTMQQSLKHQRANLTIVQSTSLLRRSIRSKLCDVAIADIECGDEWPGSIFRRFDEEAAMFPIIILCRNKKEVWSYAWKAEHAVDIFPCDIIDDDRFFSIIQAAKLRSEYVTRSTSKIDLGWPPSVA